MNLQAGAGVKGAGVRRAKEKVLREQQGENDFPDYARKTTSLVLKLDVYGGLYIGENEADWLLAHGADKRLVKNGYRVWAPDKKVTEENRSEVHLSFIFERNNSPIC